MVNKETSFTIYSAPPIVYQRNQINLSLHIFPFFNKDHVLLPNSYCLILIGRTLFKLTRVCIPQNITPLLRLKYILG